MYELATALSHGILLALSLLAAAAVCVGGLVVAARLLRCRRYLSGLAGLVAIVGTTLTGLLAVPGFVIAVTVTRGWTARKVMGDLVDDWLWFSEGFIMTVAVVLMTAAPILLSLAETARHLGEEP